MSELHGNHSVSAAEKKEHDPILSAKRVTLTGTTMQTMVDEAGAPAVTYVGRAAAGITSSDPNWLVESIAVTGSVTAIKHATGSWDNRASLTYT